MTTSIKTLGDESSSYSIVKKWLAEIYEIGGGGGGGGRGERE